METSILSAYSKNECQKYFDYLERLRQSGETNMYGAVPYLSLIHISEPTRRS